MVIFGCVPTAIMSALVFSSSMMTGKKILLTLIQDNQIVKRKLTMPLLIFEHLKKQIHKYIFTIHFYFYAYYFLSFIFVLKSLYAFVQVYIDNSSFKVNMKKKHDMI